MMFATTATSAATHSIAHSVRRTSLALVLAVLVVGCAGGEGAGLPALIPRDALFGNPERVAPRISPDGKLLAYIAPDSGVLNVWVRTLGADDDRVVTTDRLRGVRGFFWQMDGKHVIYQQDQAGDENWHIYQTNIDTRETRDLTPYPNVQAQILAVDFNHPNEILVAVNHRRPELHDVYRINLSTGAAQLDTENPGDVGGWTADNSLAVRIAQVFLPDGGTELRARPGASGPWRKLLTWGPDESFGGVVAFSADNKKALMVSSVDANAARLVELDLSTGEQKVLAEDKMFDVNQIQLNPTSYALEAVQFVRARAEWDVLDPQVRADFELLRKVKDADITVSSRTLDDTKWVVSYVSDDAPVAYYLFDRGSQSTTFLFSARPALDGYQLAKMMPISFEARDGMTIHGYLTLPVGVEPQNLPMILNVHGGPWARDQWGYQGGVQWMANRGYAVLQVNYRGSSGYGKEYLNAGDREWGGKMHDDLIDAKAWAVAEGYADSARVAIFGGSYGGYATLVGLSFTPDEFVAGVDIVGPSNLNTLLGSIPPYWAPLKSIFTKRMGDNPEFLDSRSPLTRVDQINKPLFIAQGANDPRVKQAESDQIVEAMRARSIPVEYVVYTDEGHGFARPENNLHFFGLAEAFLQKHLGGRAQPQTAVPGNSGVIK